MTVMTTQILASVLHGPKDLRIEHQTLTPPEPHELQIAISCTGICGSDLHYYSHFRLGDILVVEPLTPGHESSGEVVAIGSLVEKDWKVGDKVALEVGLPCGKSDCKQCASRRYNVCPSLRFRSSAKSVPHFQGTLKERVNHPAAFCHRLPDEMPLECGALAEPLSVAIHANQRANLPSGSEVLVMGAGPVGLLVAAISKSQGAKKVVITDLDQPRLDFALSKGFADDAFAMTARRPKDIKEALDFARSATKEMSEKGLPGQYDAVFECTGAEACLQTAIFSTVPGGKVLIIGMGNPIQTLPISQAAHREIDLIGVFRYTRDSYEQAIQILHKKNGPDFMSLVTHRFKGFTGVKEAFETAATPTDQDGKLVLKAIIDFESIDR